MTPSGFDIAECINAATAIEVDLAQLAASLTEAQFHASPRAGGWSVGYYIEHLVLVGQAFLPQWDRALREAGAFKPGAGPPARYSFWQREVLKLVERSAIVKCQSRLRFAPYQRRSMTETVNAFLRLHRELLGMVVRSRDVDVFKVKVQCPTVSWIRYPLGFSFDLVLAHERRHLRQAWRIRRLLVYES